MYPATVYIQIQYHSLMADRETSENSHTEHSSLHSAGRGHLDFPRVIIITHSSVPVLRQPSRWEL